MYFKTNNSTVTVGSTDEKSKIISDIIISGGEKATSEYKAIDGTSYPFAGTAGMVTVTFDFIQEAAAYDIVEVVYGAGTTIAGSTRVEWDGIGASETTITLSNIRSSDSITLTVTLTDVGGISCPIKYENEKGIIRTFTGIVAPENVAEAVSSIP